MDISRKTAVIKLESGGKVLQAGTSFDDFKIYELEGLSGLDFDFVTNKSPQSPNTTVNNITPLPRHIEMRIYCEGRHRQFLNRFFNPFEPGKMTVAWDGVSRWIEYYPHPVKIVQETVYRSLSVTVTLVCPEPYWRHMSDYGRNIAGKQPIMAFPFVMQRGLGLVPCYRMFNTEVLITNGGDVEVGVRIVFKALGNVRNPRLTLKNTGRFVRAVADMQKGDEIVFNSDVDDLYVTMNDGDILNLTDPCMSFFQIPTGENLIEYGADDGTSLLNVFVYFRPLYVGM